MKFGKWFKSTFSIVFNYFFAFIKWLFFGVLTGSVCGVFGSAFAKMITFVTEVRVENSWLIFLLPIGGLATVAVFKLLRVSNVGTNQVLESVRLDKGVSFWLAPAVFVCSGITHLLGGSAGREGAALQLGGGVSSLISKIFKLDRRSSHILTVCGMSAFFSAIFGTPLGAAIFAIEVVSVGSICPSAVFPSLVSSLTAFGVACLFKVEPERFPLAEIATVNIDALWRIALIAIVCAVVSVLFCNTLHISEKVFKKFFKNAFVRAFVGGVLLILLTLIVNTRDYNGGGIDIIHHIFTHGEVKFEAFALKILFTAATVVAGFKGGEIVPTLFIGATLGATLSFVVGISPAMGAAVGMAALFCGVTNCPIATIFLCTEMFGADGIVFFAVATAISFLLSGNVSLYSSQNLVYSKLRDELLS